MIYVNNAYKLYNVFLEIDFVVTLNTKLKKITLQLFNRNFKLSLYLFLLRIIQSIDKPVHSLI